MYYPKCVLEYLKNISNTVVLTRYSFFLFFIFLFAVHCVHDIDCPGTKTCINYKCTDPCESPKISSCASTATCVVINHETQCSCSPGDRGDPNLQCLALGCRNDDECPPSHACINKECKNLCDENDCGIGALCQVSRHNQTCSCPKGYEGNPSVVCRPQFSACVVDYECGVGLVCVQGACTDPCKHEKPCASNAKCIVQETRPIKSVTCTCPAGFTGDAKTQCRKSMRSFHYLKFLYAFIYLTFSSFPFPFMKVIIISFIQYLHFTGFMIYKFKLVHYFECITNSFIIYSNCTTRVTLFKGFRMSCSTCLPARAVS